MFGHFGENLHPSSISTISMALQKVLTWILLNNRSVVIHLEWVGRRIQLSYHILEIGSYEVGQRVSQQLVDKIQCLL